MHNRSLDPNGFRVIAIAVLALQDGKEVVFAIP